MSKASKHFWTQLLIYSDQLATVEPGSQEARKLASDCLGSLLEAFGGCFDPADEFEPYVTLELCKQLQKAMDCPPHE